MRARRLSLCLLGTLALAGLPAPAGAQAVGSEFQVNTYTTSDQDGASLAADAAGNFVIVWTSWPGQDGSSLGVFGQRYDSEGVSLGSEFGVNTHTTGIQADASVAATADGGFVVVWYGRGGGDGVGIFGQRYDSGGGTLGSEFRVNSYTTGTQSNPSVASDASGNFVVVWESYPGQDGIHGEVFGQRFDSAGTPRGAEFHVNSYTGGYEQWPKVASDATGNFVVVWESRGDIFGQRFDSEGVAQGEEFRVNSYTTHSQSVPSVASDASGNFVAVWVSPNDVVGQRYDAAGEALGNEFRVNSYTPKFQELPSVAFDASGNFVVAWNSDDQDGSGGGIFGQRYDSAGRASGNEFQINSFTTGHQGFASVAATGTNQFVVAWESPQQDGSGDGVFGQRLDFSGPTITVVSPNTNVKWRVGSQRRIQWTHGVGGGQTFRIELDRDNDGDYEELIAAAAPAGAARGSFGWTVSGPPSATARVRVSWSDDLEVSDASDVTFRITPAELDGER
jgi:hypothetical protein